MEFFFRRAYRGPVKAVILDWAGTAVDYGCCAPARVFVQVFADHGVEITEGQARAPMGLMKRDHIRQITQMGPVAQQWQAVHGQPAREADVEHMYADFIPLQMAILADYADPIPGTLELVADLRQRGIKIGSTTGYNREMMLLLTAEAARRGYTPDEWVCATDVAAGRPYPWMMYANEMKLGVYPPEAVVKIGDTIPDIDEGLNAGAWAIGVTLTGNEIGLTEQQVAAVPPGELATRLEAVRGRMAAAGAHWVVDGVWDCARLIEEIDQRLARGEKP
jgi:phosphonoacetaldehyde hydrolase